jgi:hypothetical protein
MNTKKSIIACALGLMSTSVMAQTDMLDGGLKQKKGVFSIYLNGGLTLSHMDAKPSKSAPIFGLGATYGITRYLDANVVLQMGTIKAGEWPSVAGVMGSSNNMFAGALTLRLKPLAILPTEEGSVMYYFNQLYGGIGVGMINSKVEATKMPTNEYGWITNYKGTNIMMPFEIGINVPVMKFESGSKVLLGLNYTANMSFSDKLDGYEPTVESNKNKDAYHQATFNIVYQFR